MEHPIAQGRRRPDPRLFRRFRFRWKSLPTERSAMPNGFFEFDALVSLMLL